MLFAVLKVFGLAVGNLLGSLSALAKQERMLVINDITSGMRAPSSMMIMMMIVTVPSGQGFSISGRVGYWTKYRVAGRVWVG